jgi:hypothetical protein
MTLETTWDTVRHTVDESNEAATSSSSVIRPECSIDCRGFPSSRSKISRIAPRSPPSAIAINLSASARSLAPSSVDHEDQPEKDTQRGRGREALARIRRGRGAARSVLAFARRR